METSPLIRNLSRNLIESLPPTDRGLTPEERRLIAAVCACDSRDFDPVFQLADRIVETRLAEWRAAPLYRVFGLGEDCDSAVAAVENILLQSFVLRCLSEVLEIDAGIALPEPTVLTRFLAIDLLKGEPFVFALVESRSAVVVGTLAEILNWDIAIRTR